MSTFIGEFEQMVLLAIMQLGDGAYAISVRQLLEERVGRSVSRGALYRTLDRLQEKALLNYDVDAPTPDRGGHARRCFQVTPEGVDVLKQSRSALLTLWDGLEEELGRS
ncbi:MAG TPA: helix-turn-helix transcriptional regulator [Acidobacteriota bacterium]|nr:helix-turn-helix transcriptional regulator [Acidobacteriota bacterium]